MKSMLIAGVAALGLGFAGAPESADAGHCSSGYGYGYSPSYGYGGGYYGGNYGYTPVYRSQSYVPVVRHRDHYHPATGPVYPNGYHGSRSYYRGGYGNSYYGNRGGISLSFGW